MDKAVNRVTTNCHHCASLRTVPTTVVKQSTNPPPETAGISFAAGVIKRAKQFILVLHECVTSGTVSSLLPNERHDTLRDALISRVSTNWPRLLFHVPRQRPSPSRPQNCSRDRQSQESRQDPCCRKSSPRTWATSTLNSRIRSRGLSARDQFSNIQIPLSDYDLISQQHTLRKANHSSSEKSKVASSPSVVIGDLVYLYFDRKKSQLTDRYVHRWCLVVG